jgi:class 3 adenylate cyclase
MGGLMFATETIDRLPRHGRFYKHLPHAQQVRSSLSRDGEDMVAGVPQKARSRIGPRRKIERRLAAILGADIVGYSALMDGREEATHRPVGAELDRVLREVERFHGRVFGIAGDGFMAEFASAVDALKCGLRIQSETARRSANLPREQQMFSGSD